MSNFLSSNDGDGLPYMQWGSDAVQWYRKDGDDKASFTFDTAVIDLEKLKVGWIKIGKGVYDAVLNSYTLPPLPRPETGADGLEYKKGFSVSVLFPEGFAQERLYSWSTSQKGSLEAMSEILDIYESGKGANAGKLPVVKFKGHENRKFGKGSTNIPKFEVVKWVDRPSAFNEIEAAPTPQSVQVSESSASEF